MYGLFNFCIAVIGITHPTFIGLRQEMPDIWLPLAMRGAMATDRFEGIPPEKRAMTQDDDGITTWNTVLFGCKKATGLRATAQHREVVV